MARKILLSIALAGLAVACGGAVKHQPAASADAPASTAAARPHPVRASRDLLDRRIGDVAVYRFSGTYRSQPITVTEEITARDGADFVVDYTLASEDETARFRVHRAVAGFEVQAVARLDGTVEVPVERAEFDAWIEKTAFAADANVGRLSRGEQTCLVGSAAHDCTVARYRVVVGDERATLTVSTSADLPGRDVAGVIEGPDGNVIYRAELVELTRGSTTATARAER